MPTSGTGGFGGRRTPKKPAARKRPTKKPAAATGQKKASVADLSKQRAKRASRGRKLGPGRGNHTGLTEEVEALILQALRTGTSIETAAAYARVSKQAVYRWLERGRKEQGRILLAMERGEEFEQRPEESVFMDFVDRCNHATASMTVTATSTLLSIMSGQMEGATVADRRDAVKFYLSHRVGEFAPISGLEVSGPAGAPIQLDQHVETAEEIRDQTASIVEVLMQSKIVRPALESGDDQPGEGHP